MMIAFIIVNNKSDKVYLQVPYIHCAFTYVHLIMFQSF